MSRAGQSVIEAFDHLPTPERAEVLRVLLSRASDDGVPSEDELAAAADDVFLRLDQQESQG